MTIESGRVSGGVGTAVWLLALAMIAAIPSRGYGDVVFTWAPTDGSASSGTMVVDAPASGPFTVSELAVRSVTFTFRPGVSMAVNFQRQPSSLPIMSFDGEGLDYGDISFNNLLRTEDFVFSFLPEQLGADEVFHDFSDPLPGERIRGHWKRLDVHVTKAPLPGGVLNVIDIRALRDRLDANMQGLAYNPGADTLYVAHGDTRSSFIYTVDMSGRLLRVLDFQSVYGPRSFPTTLSYDRATGHLFVRAFKEVSFGVFQARLIEMTVDGSAIFREIDLPNVSAGPIVTPEGIWQIVPGEKVLRHTTLDGVFIKDIPIDSSFANGGPSALAPVFSGQSADGFVLLDPGQQILRVDGDGRQVAAVTTAVLGDTITADGRGSAIATDTDPAHPRLFVVGNNKWIFVLSPDFMKIEKVNDLLRLDPADVRATYDPTPVIDGPFGTFRIEGRFQNVSDRNICSLFFRVAELSVLGRPAQRLQGVTIQATGEQVQGFDQVVFGHRPVVFPAHSETTLRFTIDMQTKVWFNFFVDAWGTPQDQSQPCP